MNRAAAIGLTNGLRNFHFYDQYTNIWTWKVNAMQVTRWYPSIIRTVSGQLWIIAGLVDGCCTFAAQMNMELFDPKNVSAGTKLLAVDLLQETGTTGYVFATLIPQSGNFFMFSLNRYGIYDSVTGAELKREPVPTTGLRSGDYPGCGVLLPLSEDATGFVRAEYVVFSGVDDRVSEKTLTDVFHVVLTGDGPMEYFYDTDPMPYGRIVSDCVLYPNGHILIFNGGRQGRTGGAVGKPLMHGSANGLYIKYFPLFSFSPLCF
jgi:hypothetical protein